MKKMALAFMLLVSSFTFAVDNSLTPAQAKNTLRIIDNVCGDVWCEGIYQYKFKSIKCDFSKSQCFLSFSYYEGSELETSKNAICVLDGLSSYSDLVSLDKKGYEDLNEKFYWQLCNTCFDKYADSWRVK